MTRDQATPVGGGGVAVEGSRDDETPAASSITASASGFGNLDWIRTGDYFDLDDDGFGISPTTDTITYSDRPPGNSFNPAHYATDDGPGASVSEASSELVAAVIRLEGEMREGVDCDFTWFRPDTGVAWNGSASIPDPSTEDCDSGPCEWWNYVYFYTFLGRDFSHGAQREITEPGVYTIEFDTNYGTYTETVDMVGPTATSCSIPNQIQQDGSGEFGVTIEKWFNDDGSYNGDVVVARKMTDNYTTRDVIHREPFSISSFTDSKAVDFEVPASSFDQFGGLGSDTPIMLYLETYGF